MVRPATPDDAPEISRMLDDFNREFGDPSPGPAVIERRVRKFITEGPKQYLLAMAGEAVTGFAQYDLHRSVWSDGAVLFLDELYVVPSSRGEGFGKALMQSMCDTARKHGLAGMEVVTGEDDIAARGLYESFGFENQIEGKEKTRSLFYELDFG